MKVQNANTAPPAGEARFTDSCLDKEDLRVAKRIAFREKDLNVVGALLDDRLVDGHEVVRRLGVVATLHQAAAEWARSWLEGRKSGDKTET